MQHKFPSKLKDTREVSYASGKSLYKAMNRDCEKNFNGCCFGVFIIDSEQVF